MSKIISIFDVLPRLLLLLATCHKKGKMTKYIYMYAPLHTIPYMWMNVSDSYTYSQTAMCWQYVLFPSSRKYMTTRNFFYSILFTNVRNALSIPCSIYHICVQWLKMICCMNAWNESISDNLYRQTQKTNGNRLI